MSWLPRLAKVALAGSAATATAYVFQDEISDSKLISACAPLKLFASTASASWTNSSSAFSDVFPISKKWEDNWDFRDPKSLVNEKKHNAADEEEKKKMLTEMTPTATRNIILIRHGQYNMESTDLELTSLGREQAAYVGARLAGLHSAKPFERLIMSTMTRATETAHIILGKLPESVVRKSDALLEEGAPYPPEPPVGHWRPHNKKFYSEGARVEAAFRKYIHRASPKQKQESFEVIVCHANVIRYFVCRALQFPPEGWLRISLGNCSITWLVVRPDGRVSIRSLGDIGHIPQDKITFT